MGRAVPACRAGYLLLLVGLSSARRTDAPRGLEVTRVCPQHFSNLPLPSEVEDIYLFFLSALYILEGKPAPTTTRLRAEECKRHPRPKKQHAKKKKPDRQRDNGRCDGMDGSHAARLSSSSGPPGESSAGGRAATQAPGKKQAVKRHHHKHNLKHRYDFLETLGKGTYGKVKKAKERSGRLVRIDVNLLYFFLQCFTV